MTRTIHSKAALRDGNMYGIGIANMTAASAASSFADAPPARLSVCPAHHFLSTFAPTSTLIATLAGCVYDRQARAVHCNARISAHAKSASVDEPRWSLAKCSLYVQL
jgi:hypothetical protein